MQIAARVMWYSPGRPKPEALIASLAQFDGQIVEDAIGAGCWPTSRRCWQSAIESGADYALVLADDALLCDEFCPVLLRAIDHCPGDILGLFALRETVQAFAHGAFAAKTPYVESNIWINGVAVVMARETAAEMLAWAEANTDTHNDEAVIQLFAAATGRKVCFCNPSIVEHDPAMVTTHASKLSNANVKAWDFAGSRAPALTWEGPIVSCNMDLKPVIARGQMYLKRSAPVLRQFGLD
jgi:hypothetical protein